MKLAFHNCNCTFPKDGNSVIFDLDKINEECPKTWSIFHEGDTNGVFQLESQLGKSLSAELKPSSIEHLSALVAIMRPGCLDTMIGDKSITQHYIDRKHGEEEVTYYHQALKPILKDTYGMLIYQEQIIKICTDIAGFSQAEADIIRRAVGHKDVELMAENKQKFLTGCADTNIVNKEEAEEIFNWIEKSQRYLFNASHSVSYATNAYMCAYSKAHFPKPFFCSYLRHSKNLDDMSRFINDAKQHDIEILPPDLRRFDEVFKITDQGIRFGITNLKGVGDAMYKKLQNKIIPNLTKYEIDLESITWVQTLIHILHPLNSTTALALIQTGGLDWLGLTRTFMRHEYNIFQELTKTEKEWVTRGVLSNIGSLQSVLQILRLMVAEAPGRGKPCSNKNRVTAVRSLIELLESPKYALVDSPGYIAGIEKTIMGAAITCHETDAVDTSTANCDCKGFMALQPSKSNVLFIAATIQDIHEIKTKKGKTPGQKMAFLTVEDGSSMMDSVVCFPEAWNLYKEHIWINNTLLLQGTKSKESFLMDKCYQL